MTDTPPALPSLRSELARALTLISAVWLFAVFLTMALVIRDEVDELMDNTLQEAAEVLYGVLVMHGHDLPLAGGGSMPAPPHDENLIWQIVDQSHQVLLRSHKAPSAALLPQFKAGLSDAGQNWRVFAMRLPGTQQVLYVGQHSRERLAARFETIVGVGASGLLVGLACALWMRRRVDQAMQPLQLLSDQVKAYDPMRAQTDLPPPGRQEFVQIQAAIVDLGRRLAQRARNEQAFAAHAAHALRTPLAGMDAQLAVALKESSATARPRLERAREAVQRLKRVITSLLAFFRSSAELNLEAVQIAELVPRLPVESLEVHVEQGCTLLADQNLLAAALLNLLDNARRYGARNCWVSSRTQGARQYLQVRDDGPGVPQQQCRTLEQNLDEPVDAGFSGLGLKLAAAVARAHKGRLLIDELPEGGGFSVTLELWGDSPGSQPAAEATR